MGNRTEDDLTFCPQSGGCVILKDSYTREISELLADRVMENYCKVPYVVINELHRSKMDANREKPEATFNDTVAMRAWDAFHDFILYAQERIQSQFGTVMNEKGIEGIRGLLFDVHGYAGFDWNATNGGSFTQWGYRLSKNTLDQDIYCPVDDRSSGTIGTLTHARDMASVGESLECLVRGPKSLGQRFNDMLPLQSYEGTPYDLCGAGLPSFDFQNPKDIASDPTYCNDNDGVCHYYSGGYDVRVHERMDWWMDPDFSGIHINTVQAELPRCIRFATDASIRDEVHLETADKLSISLCSFMHELYGNDVCGSVEGTYSPSPSGSPSSRPTVSSPPSELPSSQPSSSLLPSSFPSSDPSQTSPSTQPSALLLSPSFIPSTQPSSSPISLDPCSFILKRQKCGKAVGCTWKRGQCQSCSGIVEMISCIEATGCVWMSTTKSSTSSSENQNDDGQCNSCFDLTQKRLCKSTTGCTWKRAQCNSCAVINTQKVCERASGCYWINGKCN